MISYSSDLKIIKSIPGETIHFDGNRYLIFEKICQLIFVSPFFLCIFLAQFYFKKIPSLAGTISTVLFAIPIIIILSQLFMMISSSTLLRYLIFDNTGIIVNTSNKKRKEFKIHLNKIRKLRIVVSQSMLYTPTFRIYINHQESPIAEFKYTIPANKNLDTVFNEIASILKLNKTVIYNLNNFKVLYEYESRLNYNKPMKIVSPNFECIDKQPRLIYRNKMNPKYQATFDFSASNLTAKTNFFYTVDIDLADIQKFDHSIEILSGDSESNEHVLSRVWIQDQKGKQTDILSRKISSGNNPSDILEYDCSIELDQITNQLNKILT